MNSFPYSLIKYSLNKITQQAAFLFKRKRLNGSLLGCARGETANYLETFDSSASVVSLALV